MKSPDLDEIINFILQYWPKYTREELMRWRMEVLVILKTEIELELYRKK